jgi:hypothetical protein
MTNKQINYKVAGDNHAMYNKERQSIYHKAWDRRNRAKNTRDPEKRKKLLKEAEEFDKIWQSMEIKTPKKMGMPRIPRSYFKY